MGIVTAIILGIVQGLTEFLPISSSGHVLLVSKWLMNGEDAGAGFTAVIQIGTLLAVLIYFWSDLKRVFVGWVKSFSKSGDKKSEEARLGWALFTGTIPIVVIGFLAKDAIDGALRSPWIVAATLAGFGLLMGVADWQGRREKTLADFTIADGIKMGLWQCLALIPGSSRSGSTITGGLFMGFDRETSARFSFLLSVPAVGLSGVYKLISERENLMGAGAVPTLVATVAAFIVGYAAIAFLMNYLKKNSTWVFVIYRCILALGLVGLLASGVWS